MGWVMGLGDGAGDGVVRLCILSIKAQVCMEGPAAHLHFANKHSPFAS
jgi:hypothetical protein